MAIGNGFHHYLAWKAQTAHGTKASGATKTVVPIRSGQIFDPQPFKRPRNTVVQTISGYYNLYNIPKILPWSAEIELIGATAANDTLKDWLTSAMGLCMTAAGPPIVNTFTISDPLVDGGIDGTPATSTYGRALTLHEEVRRPGAASSVFVHEVQDAVIDEFQLILEPDQVTRWKLSGMASRLTEDDTTVSFAAPLGALHTYAEARNTANSGLRIGTANPPVAADNVVYSRAVLTIKNNIRYEPWLGLSATQEVRIPVRGDTSDVDLELTMDVEDATASQYDAHDAVDDWTAGNSVNLDFLSYITANDIFEILASATFASGTVGRGCIVDRFKFSAPGAGPMQATVGLKAYPTTLSTDFLIKFTHGT